MISGLFGKSRCHGLLSDVPITGPEGLAAAEDEAEVEQGRSGGCKTKWGRDLETRV